MSSHEIAMLPVEKIYDRIANNLNKNNLSFERHCNMLLREKKLANVHTLSANFDQYSHDMQKERFTSIKNRILNKQFNPRRRQIQAMIRQDDMSGYQSPDSVDDHDKHIIKSQMRTLDTMFQSETDFHNTRNRKNRPVQIGKFQFYSSNP